jgi:hypothetical protein
MAADIGQTTVSLSEVAKALGIDHAACKAALQVTDVSMAANSTKRMPAADTLAFIVIACVHASEQYAAMQASLHEQAKLEEGHWGMLSLDCTVPLLRKLSLSWIDVGTICKTASPNKRAKDAGGFPYHYAMFITAVTNNDPALDKAIEIAKEKSGQYAFIIERLQIGVDNFRKVLQARARRAAKAKPPSPKAPRLQPIKAASVAKAPAPTVDLTELDHFFWRDHGITPPDNRQIATPFEHLFATMWEADPVATKELLTRISEEVGDEFGCMDVGHVDLVRKHLGLTGEQCGELFYCSTKDTIRTRLRGGMRDDHYFAAAAFARLYYREEVLRILALSIKEVPEWMTNYTTIDSPSMLPKPAYDRIPLRVSTAGVASVLHAWNSNFPQALPSVCGEENP